MDLFLCLSTLRFIMNFLYFRMSLNSCIRTRRLVCTLLERSLSQSLHLDYKAQHMNNDKNLEWQIQGTLGGGSYSFRQNFLPNNRLAPRLRNPGFATHLSLPEDRIGRRYLLLTGRNLFLMNFHDTCWTSGIRQCASSVLLWS